MVTGFGARLNPTGHCAVIEKESAEIQCERPTSNFQLPTSKPRKKGFASYLEVRRWKLDVRRSHSILSLPRGTAQIRLDLPKPHL
jgi:hypothetical protein